MTRPATRFEADSVAAREVVLFATNDGDFYRSNASPAITNLAKRQAKGTFDFTKSLVLWGYAATEACRLYNLRYGNGRRSVEGFNPVTRNLIAQEFAEHYQEEIAFAANVIKANRNQK